MTARKRNKKGNPKSRSRSPEPAAAPRKVPIRSRSRIVAVCAIGAAGVAALFVFVFLPRDHGAVQPLVGDGRTPPNILLVTLDTTRADRIGCYGYQQARTPTIDALAASGVRFDQAFAHVPLTFPSHAALLTGLHPISNGLRINLGGALSPDILTLPQWLGTRGYRTGAFLASWVLDSDFGLDLGFDTYDDEMGAAEDGKGEAKVRTADRVCDSALAWMEATGEVPFFAWVHFFDPHAPYSPPEPYSSELASAYDGEIAFVDAQLGRLVSWLDRKGLRDRTLVIVAGDHGEAFGEHGEQSHGILLYNTTLRIPLVLSWPGELGAGRVVDGAVGLIDLFPTVVALLDRESPAKLQGRSLLPALRAQPKAFPPVYAESEYPLLGYGWAALHAIISDGWKYIEAPQAELYRLPDDPGEETNLLEQEPDVAARLRLALSQHIEQMPARVAEHVAFDERALERLQSLGYIAGARTTPANGVRRDPKDMIDVHRGVLRAQAAAQEERHGYVVTVLEPLAEKSPESDEVHGLLGTAYLELGRYEEAARAFEMSLRSRPGFSARLGGLGDALRMLGRLDEAVECYQAALIASPDFAQVHSRLGMVYGQQGKMQDAYGHFHRYAELAPDSANAHFNLANILQALQRPTEAVSHLEQAVDLDPSCVPCHEGLLRALFAEGRLVDVVAVLRAAHVALPDNRAFTKQLAWLLATSPMDAIRNGDEAVRVATELVDVTGETSGTLDVLAAAHAAKGEFAEAVAGVRRALELVEPQNAALKRRLEDHLTHYLASRPLIE